MLTPMIGFNNSLIFGNPKSAITPFPSDLSKEVRSNLTGRTEPLRYAPQNNQHPTPEVTQEPQLTQYSSLIVFALPVFLIKWNKQYQSFSSQTGR